MIILKELKLDSKDGLYTNLNSNMIILKVTHLNRLHQQS